jgi:hypothetical protein
MQGSRMPSAGIQRRPAARVVPDARAASMDQSPTPDKAKASKGFGLASICMFLAAAFHGAAYFHDAPRFRPWSLALDLAAGGCLGWLALSNRAKSRKP